MHSQDYLTSYHVCSVGWTAVQYIYKGLIAASCYRALPISKFLISVIRHIVMGKIYKLISIINRYLYYLFSESGL